MSLLCQVFGSARQPEMYLYVAKARGLADVPERLLGQFGEPRPVLTLLLSAQRKLARVAVADVLRGIESEGYYLQLPPASIPGGDLPW